MTRIVTLLFAFVCLTCTAQTVDTSYLQRYRFGQLDTARHMPAPQRAHAYWQAASYYIVRQQWDSAARAEYKLERLMPVDSMVNGDVFAMLQLSDLDRNIRRMPQSLLWAEAAMRLARSTFPPERLVPIAQHLQALYTEAGNDAKAWQYKYFSDSLVQHQRQLASADSLARLHALHRDVQQQRDAATAQLKQAQAENERLTQQILYPLAALSVLLFIACIALIVFRRKPKANAVKASVPSVADDTPLRAAAHDMIGFTDLLLQRGRTGDDLLWLKAMERELQTLRQSIFPGESSPRAVTEDTVIRALKNIRILVIADKPDDALLLKSWLRKQIRLCEIVAIESLDTLHELPPNFQPHAVVADALRITNQQLQTLHEKFPTATVIASTASKENLAPHATLRKPYDLHLLLDVLMTTYKPENDATEIAAPRVATLDMQTHCAELEDAYMRRDGDALTHACMALLPLFERTDAPAVKWLKLLADPPENISEVQIELAYKNVVTYCRQAVGNS